MPTSEAISDDEETTPFLPRAGCQLVAASAIEPSNSSVAMADTNSVLRLA